MQDIKHRSSLRGKLHSLHSAEIKVQMRLPQGLPASTRVILPGRGPEQVQLGRTRTLYVRPGQDEQDFAHSCTEETGLTTVLSSLSMQLYQARGFWELMWNSLHVIADADTTTCIEDG
jgi:hypothetical protein